MQVDYSKPAFITDLAEHKGETVCQQLKDGTTRGPFLVGYNTENGNTRLVCLHTGNIFTPSEGSKFLLDPYYLKVGTLDVERDY